MEHLKYSGKSRAEQGVAFERIIRESDLLMPVLRGLVELDFPDWMLVSGALYNTVWNSLTARDPLLGIKDVDVFYFDAGDLSYDAEDICIKRADQRFAGLQVPLELRNQARVHLWYPQKFGEAFLPLSSSTEMLARFASETHAIGVRLEKDGRLTVRAPFGLDHIFSFRIVPNRVLNNQISYEEKSARASKTWPELSIERW